jgi:hypothetical protein
VNALHQTINPTNIFGIIRQYQFYIFNFIFRHYGSSFSYKTRIWSAPIPEALRQHPVPVRGGGFNTLGVGGGGGTAAADHSKGNIENIMTVTNKKVIAAFEQEFNSVYKISKKLRTP